MISNQQSINSFGRIAATFQVCDFVSLDEIISYLKKDARLNSILLSLLLEQGTETPLGNGSFSTYQNIYSDIEGVALIGDKFFFNAISESALECFAEIACSLKTKTFALCEKSYTEQFYKILNQNKKDYVIHCEEILMVFDSELDQSEPSFEFIIADKSHLESIVKANSEIMLSERGYDPLVTNADSFIQSCRKLIDQNRCLVLFKDNEIACKIDLSMTNSLVTYIEGFYVNPKFRRQGLGFSSMLSLISKFKKASKFIALLVDSKNKTAFSLYEKCGFQEVSRFSVSTIYPNELAS